MQGSRADNDQAMQGSLARYPNNNISTNDDSSNNRSHNNEPDLERSQSQRSLAGNSLRSNLCPGRAVDRLERGDSVRSLEVLPAAETTRPTQFTHNNSSSQRLSSWSGAAKEVRRGGSDAYLSGGESQRSVMSSESLRSISALEEEDKQRMIEELETLRVAEEAQEEELIRLAMERSLTETSDGNIERRLNYQEGDSPLSARHNRRPAASPPSRQRLAACSRPALRSSMRGATAPTTSGTTNFHSARSLGEPVEHHRHSFADEFRRAASERIRIAPQNDAADFFDLSPRDEADYRRVLRIQPPLITNLDNSSSPLPSPREVRHGVVNVVNGPSLTSPNVRPGTAVTVNSPPPTHPMQSPRGPDSSWSPRQPGVVSVRSPAPKVKSPRRRTVEGLFSPAIDRLSNTTAEGGGVGGTAESVHSPALTAKSEQVRAAIKAHVSSPLIFQRSPIESPALQPVSCFPEPPPRQEARNGAPKPVVQLVMVGDVGAPAAESHLEQRRIHPTIDSNASNVKIRGEGRVASERMSGDAASCDALPSSCRAGPDDAVSRFSCARERLASSFSEKPDVSFPQHVECGSRIDSCQLPQMESCIGRHGGRQSTRGTVEDVLNGREEIGPVPCAGPSDSIRDAVMQLAKLHLPPLEVQLIDEALRKGAQQQQTDEAHSKRARGSARSVWHAPPEQPNETHLLDWPTPSEQAQRVAPLLIGTKKDMLSSSNLYSFGPSESSWNLSAEERRDIEQALRESEAAMKSDSDVRRTTLVSEYDLSGAEDHLSEEELQKIQQALEEIPENTASKSYDDEDVKPAAIDHISEEDSEAIARAVRDAEEEEAIARALREADEEEEQRSLQLALKMQQEEEETASGGSRAARQKLQQQGNVRTLTRAEYELQGFERGAGPSLGSASSTNHPLMADFDQDEDYLAAGYRMNSTARQQWSRRDQNSIVGPNWEVRTKHDTALHSQANAHRLGLDVEEVTSVGNQAYNSFLQSIKATKKGVATKGTGRAGSDTDATKGGAMDPKVRVQISRAINNKIIEKCNGVVKEGKEAVVYHANKGEESGGFDVAVKVFKRIEEFRARGDYVDGDPRYGRSSFRNLSSREQLELWAEKEFRNLVRANRAGVPVPTPILHKENIVFMRFLGEDGWPAPQLRELKLRRGSKRWITLYTQVLDAVER